MKVITAPWQDQLQVIANEDILAGDIVIKETPLVSVTGFSDTCERLTIALLKNEDKLLEYLGWDLHVSRSSISDRRANDIVSNHLFHAFKTYQDKFVYLYYSVFTNAINSKNVHGLYNLLSRVNHSCTPNCMVCDVGTLVAMENIKKGDPITYSYIGDTFLDEDCKEIHFVELGYKHRNVMLLTLGFICQCGRCKKEKDVSDEAIHECLNQLLPKTKEIS